MQTIITVIVVKCMGMPFLVHKRLVGLGEGRGPKYISGENCLSEIQSILSRKRKIENVTSITRDVTKECDLFALHNTNNRTFMRRATHAERRVT